MYVSRRWFGGVDLGLAAVISREIAIFFPFCSRNSSQIFDVKSVKSMKNLIFSQHILIFSAHNCSRFEDFVCK